MVGNKFAVEFAVKFAVKFVVRCVAEQVSSVSEPSDIRRGCRKLELEFWFWWRIWVGFVKPNAYLFQIDISFKNKLRAVLCSTVQYEIVVLAT